MSTYRADDQSLGTPTTKHWNALSTPKRVQISEPGANPVHFLVLSALEIVQEAVRGDRDRSLFPSDDANICEHLIEPSLPHSRKELLLAYG